MQVSSPAAGTAWVNPDFAPSAPPPTDAPPAHDPAPAAPGGGLDNLPLPEFQLRAYSGRPPDPLDGAPQHQRGDGFEGGAHGDGDLAGHHPPTQHQREQAPERRPGEPSPPAGGEPILVAKTAAVDPAAPATPAAPVGPTADPMEIAALELLLAEPANRELIEHFGGELQPLPTWTSVGQGIEARYGADLGGRLYQLQQAQRKVEGEFFQAMDQAQQSPPDPSKLITRHGEPEPTSGQPGWLYHPGSGGLEGDPPSWQFDPGAFARHYAAGDSPAQRAFAHLHGSDPVQFVRAPDTETAGPDSWQLAGLTLRLGRPLERDEGLTPDALHAKDGWVQSGVWRPDYLNIDPDRITKLHNKELVWFDPVHGWSTDPENIKGDFLDRAMPYIFAGAVTAMTFGAGSTVAASISSAAGGGASGSIAVGAATGAVSSAALQLAANGKISFGQLLQSAPAGGATAGMTQLPGVGQYLDGQASTFGGRLMEYTGRATVQGAIQSVLGGKFRDGFANSLMGSVAGEVTAQLNAQIGQMQGLSASEASALRLLTRATGSALRLVGSNDPGAEFASDFLGGLVSDGLATHPPAESDPLGQFIAANEDRRGVRQSVADLFDGVLDAPNVPTDDRIQLAAGDGFLGDINLPESWVRSGEFARGFVDGGGISILQSYDALASIAREPGQFIDGVHALLTSSQARSRVDAARASCTPGIASFFLPAARFLCVFLQLVTLRLSVLPVGRHTMTP